jgi:hypothetical protein
MGILEYLIKIGIETVGIVSAVVVNAWERPGRVRSLDINVSHFVRSTSSNTSCLKKCHRKQKKLSIVVLNETIPVIN